MGTYYNRLSEAVLTSTHNLCFGAKTRIVRGSDYSPAKALSEDKDIFSNCDAPLQKMILYNPNIDLVNDNVYTKFG